MERWRNCVAVVTGASSGIGADITKSLLQAGLRVVGLARRDHLINEMRNTLPAELQKNLYALKCDVSVRDSVNKCFDWIEENLGGVDVLINNAAIFKSGELLTMDITAIESAVATNILGFVYCVRRAANSMKSRKVAGHIVFVNSVVGHYLINALPDSKPAFNIYPCTKHATVVMTEILRQELRFSQTNIKITSISPGAVQTDMLPTRFKDLPTLSPADISAAVLHCMSTPQHVQVHEMMIKPMGEPF